MKLADWAKKEGISYLTAYRWFINKKLPVEAYQTDSGTIIVKDESEDLEFEGLNKQNDAFSLFLKTTIEFSKNGASVEDFAAFILSNFSLKILASETPKYSRQKPEAKEVQKHFKKFIPKGEKPKTNMFVATPQELDDLVAKDNGLEVQGLVNQIHVNDEGVPTISHTGLEVPATAEMKDLLIGFTTAVSNVVNEGDNVVTNFSGLEGVNLTSLSPQLLDYAGSNYTFTPEGDTFFQVENLSSSISFKENESINLNSNLVTDNIYMTRSLVSPQVKTVEKPKRGRPKKR